MKKQLLFLVLVSLSLSANSQVPYVFSDGTPAHAAEVNANFEALTQRLDELESEIQELKSHNVAGHTYKIEALTTLFEKFDGDSQNSTSDSGFWNIDLSIEVYLLKFNDDAERTVTLQTEEHREGNLRQDGSMYFYQEEVGEIKTLYWTQTGNSISLSKTLNGSSEISMSVIDGASGLYSLTSGQKSNEDTGEDSCGDGTQRCFADEFSNVTLIGIRID